MEGEPNFRPWDELAPDVLVLVFKKIPPEDVLEDVSLVCKSWCKVVMGPHCWDKIDKSEWRCWSNPEKNDWMLRTLIPRSSGSLREVSVSDVDDQMFSFIAEHAGSLQTLIVDASSISDSIVEKMAPKFSSLTTLEISHCYEISTRALEAIGTNCKMLVSLSWNHNQPSWKLFDKQRLEEAVANTISRIMPMPKLKHLSIAHLKISTSAVLDILSCCPELESLDIRGCKCVTLDGKFLEENYPKLKVEGPDTLSDSDYDDDYYDDDYGHIDGMTYDSDTGNYSL